MIKLGLALGGGGAKGSYQLGVIKAIEEFNFLDSIDVISGTSIGAINTLLLMGNLNHEEMLEIWKNLRNKDIYQSGINLSLKSEEFFDLRPLFSQLSNNVSTKNIKNSKFDCYVMAAEVPDSQKRLTQFRYKEMKKKFFHLNTFMLPRKAVLASSSIPGLFGPTTILGKKYVDGGIIDNHSMDPIIDNECNIIFNIPVDQFFDVKPYIDKPLLMIDFTSKMAFHSTLLMDFIDAIRFDTKRIEERYRYGYLVGQKLMEKLYYSDFIKNDLTFNKPSRFNMLTLSPEEDMEIYNKVRKEFKNE